MPDGTLSDKGLLRRFRGRKQPVAPRKESASDRISAGYELAAQGIATAMSDVPVRQRRVFDQEQQ